MIKYIAIDPGESVGIAEFDEEGTFLKRFIIRRAFLGPYLTNRLDIQYKAGIIKKPTHIICENFRSFPGMEKHFILNTFNVVKVIGFVEGFAFMSNVEFILQEPNERVAAERWLGFNYKSHTPDDKAAHAHGVKWLVSNHILDIEKAIKDNEEYDQRKH